MKASNTLSLNSRTSFPSLFQIAAFFEDFFPAAEFKRPETPAKHLPISEVMVDPDKLMSLLRFWEERRETSVSVASVAAINPNQNASKRNGRSEAAKKTPGKSQEKSNPPPDSQKQVEFSLKSPRAKSVKLAGDFTGWEKSPVEMRPVENGAWSAVVQLAPGTYAYLFIVDGNWCDDPGSNWHAPNPFGSKNAVIHVT